MNPAELKRLLKSVARGKTTPKAALAALEHLQHEDLGFAKLDHHRELRCGFPEVVFCQGKRPDHSARIAEKLFAKSERVLLTRVDEATWAAVHARVPSAERHDLARAITIRRGRRARPTGLVAVVCAGTADVPVAEEARVTAQMMGAKVETRFDVGVAGLHRILGERALLRKARVLVVVAGMEGALASVVGGLSSRPVIAVPTSIGYGAHWSGLAPLLAMMNSCAPNVSVVNIDNGFGAGYVAALINRT